MPFIANVSLQSFSNQDDEHNCAINSPYQLAQGKLGFMVDEQRIHIHPI